MFKRSRAEGFQWIQMHCSQLASKGMQKIKPPGYYWNITFSLVSFGIKIWRKMFQHYVVHFNHFIADINFILSLFNRIAMILHIIKLVPIFSRAFRWNCGDSMLKIRVMTYCPICTAHHHLNWHLQSSWSLLTCRKVWVPHYTLPTGNF